MATSCDLLSAECQYVLSQLILTHLLKKLFLFWFSVRLKFPALWRRTPFKCCPLVKSRDNKSDFCRIYACFRVIIRCFNLLSPKNHFSSHVSIQCSTFVCVFNLTFSRLTILLAFKTWRWIYLNISCFWHVIRWKPVKAIVIWLLSAKLSFVMQWQMSKSVLFWSSEKSYSVPSMEQTWRPSRWRKIFRQKWHFKNTFPEWRDEGEWRIPVTWWP